MSECTHDCSNCSANCADNAKQEFAAKPHKQSKIKKVIGVVSGKGGVGKSLVTSLLATEMQRKNYHTAILDADITGPSIPQIFGLHENATYDETGIYPVVSQNGTQIMSINLLLEDETDPVVWRGPVIAGAVTQFWTDVVWTDVDFMFVDMPPGTGDVALTVFQSLPVDGIVVVTSPQELVEMIVGKAVKMANMLNVPVLGVVENFSYFVCDGCGKKHSIFGESNTENFALQHGIDTVCKLPINPALAKLCDQGQIESFNQNLLEKLTAKLEKSLQK
ncbi:MAG: P-loop NTPase [Candidatus Fimimonas sp.]